MAKTVCKLLGVTSVIFGSAGFFWPHLLGTHLNFTHCMLHIVLGAIAAYIGFAGSTGAALVFCLLGGLGNLLLGVGGWLLGTGPDRMFYIDDLLMLGKPDHIIHAFLGVAFLAAWGLARRKG